MRSNRFTTIISQALVATGLVLGSTLASAATVSMVPTPQDVFSGDTITVNFVATDLINAAGGSMDVTWDASVLTMTDVLTDVVIATPPWDDPDTSTFSDRGVLTPGLLSGIRVGTFTFVTGAADLFSLTFTAADTTVELSTLITVADGAGPGGGWSPPGMLYEAGTVNVPGIPIPAAVWLFGSGLLGLVGVARRRQG